MVVNLIELDSSDENEKYESDIYFEGQCKDGHLKNLKYMMVSKEAKYPKMDRLARRFLTIPATSVISDITLSTIDSTITKQRDGLHSVEAGDFFKR